MVRVCATKADAISQAAAIKATRTVVSGVASWRDGEQG